MIERAPIPQFFEDVYDSLPKHTRYWLELDLEDRPATERQNLYQLTYEAFGLMLLPENKDRKWSIKKLRHQLDRETKRDWPIKYLEEASTLALLEFVEKGILGSADGRWPFDYPVGRGSRFVLRKGKFTQAEGINCMIAAGEACGVEQDALQDLREHRNQLRISIGQNFQ